MSQGDSYGRQKSLREEKWDRGGQEAAGDGAASRLVEVFQFDDIDND